MERSRADRGIADSHTMRVPPASGSSRSGIQSVSARALGWQSTIGNRATAQALQRLSLEPTWRTRDRVPAGVSELGFDYGWGDRQKMANDAQDWGATFVVRYLSPQPSKNLTRSEAKFWQENDVSVVVVWESGGNRASAGYDAGRADAKAARAQADACGAPDSAAIYFAVDFDANPVDVYDYFDGIAGGINPERVGAYAGYRVIKGLFDTGRIAYGWQTLAWSRDYSAKGHPLQWHPDACLRQVTNATAFGRGQTVDLDHAMCDDFGQWVPGD